MEGGHFFDDHMALEEIGYDEFEAKVPLNKWPTGDLISCPECDAMLPSVEAVVSHSVESHRWGENSRSTVDKFMLNDFCDPLTTLRELLSEEYKGQNPEKVVPAYSKEAKAEVSLELTLGSVMGLK